MPAGCSYVLKTSSMVSIFEMINVIIAYLFIYFNLLLPHMKTHHQFFPSLSQTCRFFPLPGSMGKGKDLGEGT